MKGCAAAIACVAWTVSESAILDVPETFASQNGWVDRDASEMVVAPSVGTGNPAGSLEGTFATQGFAFPETDAFRITSGSSGGNFTGNYFTTAPGFTSFEFDFLASDVLASDLILRISGNSHLFILGFSSQVTGVGSWQHVTMSLNHAAGWLGGSASDFNDMLGGVDFIDVQVSRNGATEQSYYVDNFVLSGTELAEGSVPEPRTLGYLLLMGVLVVARTLSHRSRLKAGV